MKSSKLLTLGLSFAFAVGCCAVATSAKTEMQSVSAETENPYVYSIENYTKGTLYELDFVNDYFGYGAPYEQYASTGVGSSYSLKKAAGYCFRVAYTYDACYDEDPNTPGAQITVSNVNFVSQYTRELYMTVAPNTETGKYEVTNITHVAGNTKEFTLTVPENGYTVLTKGSSGGYTEFTNNFSVGDEVSGVINKHQYELKNLSTQNEYSLRLTFRGNGTVLDANLDGNTAWVLTPQEGLSVTQPTLIAARSYIKAQLQEDGTYKVTNVHLASEATINAADFKVGVGEILIGLGRVYRTTMNYMAGGFVSAVKVGDILSLTDHSQDKNVEGASLTLSGAIGLNLKLALGTYSDGTQIVFKSGETELSRTPLSEITSVDNLTWNGVVYKNWYKVSCPVLAKDYDQDITLEVQDPDNNVILTQTYSVEDYAETIANGEYSQELKDATKALVDYCKAACDYANGAAVTAEKTDLVLSAYAPTQSGDATVSDVSMKLVLDSDTELRVYFTAENLPVCTVAGVEQTPVSLGDNRYYVTYTDIGAHELTKGIEFAFGEYKINCSAMSYAYVVLSNDAYIESQAGLYNAMKAMYNYYAEVDAYVKSLEG